MRYGIFSDVHSNLEAFEAVLEVYKKENIDKYLCVGDIVGYGANPDECIQLVKGLNCVCVAGNHDVSTYDLDITKNFTDIARIAAEWTFDKISEFNKDYLRSLKYTYEEEDLILVHASLDRPEEFFYIENSSDARDNFTYQERQLCFVGHSHAPLIFRQSDEDIELLNSFKIKIDEFSKYLVNVGSVGQPRDRDNRAAYCVFDTEEKTVEIKRIGYNILPAAEKILKAGLPARLAERLFEGQ